MPEPCRSKLKPIHWEASPSTTRTTQDTSTITFHTNPKSANPNNNWPKSSSTSKCGTNSTNHQKKLPPSMKTSTSSLSNSSTPVKIRPPSMMNCSPSPTSSDSRKTKLSSFWARPRTKTQRWATTTSFKTPSSKWNYRANGRWVNSLKRLEPLSAQSSTRLKAVCHQFKTRWKKRDSWNRQCHLRSTSTNRPKPLPTQRNNSGYFIRKSQMRRKGIVSWWTSRGKRCKKVCHWEWNCKINWPSGTERWSTSNSK